MNEIFDTHCHLADEKYHKEDIKKIIEEAEREGVKHILNVGYDQLSNKKVMEQLLEFPELFVALGLHPNSTDDLQEENLKWIEKQLFNKKIIAIGEIGLDYYRNFTPKIIQKIWFKKQLEIAKKYNLPVLLHLRSEDEEAFIDAYQITKKVGNNKGILHCFTGSWETAENFINIGFYISFAGNITYESGKWKDRLKATIIKIPLEKIVIETDAPYLSPKPVRGQINYPKNIIHTLIKLAEIKEIKPEEVNKQIYRNTLNLLLNS